MQTNSKTFRLVLTALMMCLIMVAILFIRVPIPFTQGYVHLGDAMIFLAVLVLGWKYGAVAGGARRDAGRHSRRICGMGTMDIRDKRHNGADTGSDNSESIKKRGYKL